MNKTRGTKIKDFPNYEITKDGKVWKIKQQIYMKPFENVMKHRPNNQYYLRIALSNKGKRKKFMVHRLVADAYIPNPLNKPFINHKNGNKHDNRIENLEWVTTKENSHHASKNNLIYKKLSDEQVIEIRSDKFKGYIHQDIADYYNVSRRLIGMILKNKRRVLI